MTQSIGPREFHVTNTVGVKELEAFLNQAGPGRLRQRASATEGEVVLYVAPKPRFSFTEQLSRLWNRRQVKHEEGSIKGALQNLFVRSLPDQLKSRAEFLRSQVAATSNGITTESVHRHLQLFDKITSSEPVGANGRFSTIERFAGQEGIHTGGKTGSVQVKAGEQRFQMKFDIQNASTGRNFLERGLNVQNVSEVLASAVMRSELQADEAMRAQSTTAAKPHRAEPGLFEHTDVGFEFPDRRASAPERPGGLSASDLFFAMLENAPVEGKDPAPAPDAADRATRFPPQRASLMRAPNVVLLDSATSHIGVASEYLAGGKGDLEQYFRDKLGGAIPEGRHVKVIVGSETPPDGTPSLAKDADRADVIHINGQAATDLYDHLASTLWLGDYDFNPAKFVVQDGGDGVLRLGCIDLAHAFQNLTEGRGATLVKLGEAAAGNLDRESDNSFVRATNQKRLRGNILNDGGGRSKIWRDYEGLAPSLGMAHALQRLAARPNAHEQGLDAAKEHIMGLVQHLQAHPTPDNKKKLENLLQTLAQISEHEGHSVRVLFRKPAAVVDEVIGHLKATLTQRREEAQFAGDLCELQASVIAHLMPRHGEPSVSQGQLASVYQSFRDRHGDVLKKELVWFVESADAPPFKGTYEQFVDDRLALRAGQAAPVGQAAPAA